MSVSKSASKGRRRSSYHRSQHWHGRIFRLVTQAAQVILLALVAITPWAVGSVGDDAIFRISVVVAGALLLWGASLFVEKRPDFRAPWESVPLVLAILLAISQLIPWPGRLQGFLAPGSVEVREEVRGSFQDVPAGEASEAAEASVMRNWPRTTSLYPAATRRQLALLILAMACFFLGARFFAHRHHLVRLNWVLAVNGAALAFFGLVQQSQYNGKLYWVWDLLEGGAPFGPFVNRNNAGGYLNLCLAGAIALVVWSFSSAHTEHSGPPTSNVWERFVRRLGRLNAVQLTAVVLAACIAGGVLCTFSRGAVISTAVALAVTTVALGAVRRRSTTAWLLGIVLTLGFAVVGWVGQLEPVRERMATVLNYPTREERLTHWQDTLAAASNFGLRGSGLGTYSWVYRIFQVEPNEFWFSHAENQYLEALVEAGWPGVLLLVVMIAAIGYAAARVLVHSRHLESQSLALLGIFALVSQAVHAFFDFGLYIPANTILFALICGSVAGRAVHRVEEAEDQSRTDLAGSMWEVWILRLRSPYLVVPVLLVPALWASYELYRVSKVRGTWKDAQYRLREMAESNPPPSEQASLVRTACRQLERALAARPDDAEMHWRLATLYMARYSVLAPDALQGGRDAKKFVAALPPEQRALLSGLPPRGLQDPLLLNHLVLQLERGEHDAALRVLQHEPIITNNLAPARKHLLEADLHCPINADVKYRLGQISQPAGDSEQEIYYLLAAGRLAPKQPELQYQIGRMHWLRYTPERDELAFRAWRVCLAAGRQYEKDILNFALHRKSLEEVIATLLPDDPEVLLRVAVGYFAAPEQIEQRKLLVERAEAAIGDKDPSPQWYYQKGRLYGLNGDFEAAEKSYRTALQQDPNLFACRLDLAKLLRSQGKLSEAFDEVQECIRMQPDNRTLKNLERDIHRELRAE